MNKGEEHKELIQQVAERLRNHTEPYKEGAWERFAAAYGHKRRRRMWPYWSAAAILLATIGLYLTVQQPNESATQPQFVQQDAMPQSVAPTEIEEHEQEESERPETVVGSAILPAHDQGKTRPHHEEVEQDLHAGTQAVGNEMALVKDSVGDHRVADRTSVLADTASTPDHMPNRLAAAIETEGAGHPDAYTKMPPKSDSGMEKWDVGLVVSPSLTSETVNIGGGLAVAYRISDKFSIGSGISIAQLGVGENPNYRPGYTSRQSDLSAPTNPSVDYPVFNGKSEAALGYKQEVSLTSSVVTLDIPLDIRYEVAKGFYTSLGVSYVAILNEQRTGHYIDKINTNTFTNGSSADRLAPTEFVYSSEKISDKPLRGNGYAGFMNFSIGKKLPISTKLFLSVEPYFKLPIGRLSKEEMNFTNGGIRVVTGF